MSSESSEIAGSLVCVAMPPDTRITGLDDQLRVVLRTSTKMFKIGALSTADVVVRSPHIARSQASLVIVFADGPGRCRVRDSGHNFTVRVNGEHVVGPRVLAHGDVIEPWLFDKPLGLRFRFESIAG